MEYYKNCSQLPLKVFFEIADTGNLNLLVKDGKLKEDQLIEIWESIIEEYAKLDNNQEISTVKELKSEMVFNLAQYLEVVGMLIFLEQIEYNEYYVERLNELGYRISPINYMVSIENGKRRSNHVVTRLMFIQKDLEKFKVGKKSSFDECMAWLMANNIGSLDDNITVARYLNVKKIINERNKASRHNKR